MRIMNIDILDLIAPVLGPKRASEIQRAIAFPTIATIGTRVSRALVAQGLNAVLFADLLDRVPTGDSYVADVVKAGGRINFDHGALRTVYMPNGYRTRFPNGSDAFARLLKPLGYHVARAYPLPALRMTGYAFCHKDLPEGVPQFFVSELHVTQFRPAFVAATERVFGQTQDPVDASTQSLLDMIEAEGALDLELASCLIADLRFCFGRHHGPVELADYETLLEASAEAAWIATEGNAFNHVTDRVPNVDALAAHQREIGRPIKDRVERSGSGRVRQTAFKADHVDRAFRAANGETVTRQVPGSFYEFITRDIDPATNLLDLSFDSGNAQGIFAMTAAA
jgi:Domain of unknown function (DUF1338)